MVSIGALKLHAGHGRNTPEAPAMLLFLAVNPGTGVQPGVRGRTIGSGTGPGVAVMVCGWLGSWLLLSAKAGDDMARAAIPAMMLARIDIAVSLGCRAPDRLSMTRTVRRPIGKGCDVGHASRACLSISASLVTVGGASDSATESNRSSGTLATRSETISRVYGGRGGIRTPEGASTPWRFSRPLP
jgi:hypothetical protein